MEILSGALQKSVGLFYQYTVELFLQYISQKIFLLKALHLFKLKIRLQQSKYRIRGRFETMVIDSRLKFY